MFIVDDSIISDNSIIRDNALNADINDLDFVSKLDTEHSTALIKAVNGAGFDNAGNIVSADGKTKYSIADIRKELKEYYSKANEPNPLDFEAITIGDVSYKINEKGEAVDAQGKVVKTVDEVKALIKDPNASHSDPEPDPNDVGGIIKAANQKLGIDFLDSEGNAIEFEPTPDGIAARDQYIIENVANNIVANTFAKFFEENPELESLYNYKQQNNSVDGWAYTPSYKNIVLLKSGTKEADAQHLDIIIKAEMALGKSKEEAEIFAKYLVDDGKSEEFAKKSLDKLVAMDAAKEAKTLADQKAADDARKADIDAYWKSVSAVIDKGEAHGIQIPAFIAVKNEDGSISHVPRRHLFDYMSKPVDNGRSRYQIEKTKMTPEEVVIDALLKFTKYNYSDIVKKNIAAEKVVLMRKVKAGNAGNAKPNGGGAGGKSPVDSVIL